MLCKNTPADISEYERFVENHPNGGFMQSISWARTKAAWRWEAIVVKDGLGSVAGTMLILIRPILGGLFSLLYAPRGPVCDYADEGTLRRLFDEAKRLAAVHRGILFLVDPCISENDTAAIGAFLKMGLVRKKAGANTGTVQTRHNYLLPLSGWTEEALLKSFRPKCRYNIGLAKRKGVVCLRGGAELISPFYTLLKETAKRDNFFIRDQDYFEDLCRNFGAHLSVFICYCDGIPLSAAILMVSAKVGTYLYGASSSKDRACMPANLMQWEMIRHALKEDCRCYDFGGVSFYDRPEHPSFGVYRFKTGFQGELVHYAGDFEIRFRPLCALIYDTARRARNGACNMLKSIRRTIKGDEYR